ncbi:MAG: 50S ribosomal protein L25/general stress protein Ctc [bacterium]
MKFIDLKGSIRESVGKKDSKKLRKKGNVPCVLYGGEEIKHFHAHENTFKDLIYTHVVYIVNLEIDGEKHKAILKDIQFHPVTDKILHIDFIEVFDDEPVVVHMPIELTGSSEGIKAGGKLRQRRRELKVKALYKDLPDVLKVDITKLNIGDTLKVGDLSYPNIEMLDPHRAMVVGVVSSRLISKAMREEEPTPEETVETATVEPQPEAEGGAAQEEKAEE